MLLKLKDLRVSISPEKQKNASEESEILKGLNWGVGKGQIKALLGPNGSGKSVLAQTISGNPNYQVTKGNIIFNGEGITNIAPEKITQKGIALSWQNPPSVEGITLSTLLNHIPREEEKEYTSKQQKLLKREVGVNLSGGEKKISELTQIMALNPKLAILDEIDSGLDMEKIHQVSGIIKSKLAEKGVSLILITHSGEILNFLKPDTVTVLVDGSIICEGDDHQKVLNTIKEYGYEKCKEHSLSLRG